MAPSPSLRLGRPAPLLVVEAAVDQAPPGPSRSCHRPSDT